MKQLSRINPTYSLNNLPRLKSRKAIIRGRTCYTGTILRRRVQGPVKIYWHYAFTYGFDLAGHFLLIENNKDGVECITWNDFRLKEEWEIFHIEADPKNFAKIMTRAKKRVGIAYDANKNNCEHFTNICVLNKKESVQVDNTKVAIDIGLSFIETTAVLNSSPAAPAFLRIMNRLRDSLEIERGMPEIEDIVKERIKLDRS